MKFFKDWLNGNTNEVSSRRGIATVSLLLVSVMAIGHTLGQDIDSDIYLGTVALVAAALGLTLYNFKK